MKLYFRLAAGGIRRNSRLYVPYIMTCSLMVMMYYITDALSGDEMLSAMRGGYIMHELIVIGKVVMALFAAIFLFYTNSFLIKSRMREFGLYNILGMGKNGPGHDLGNAYGLRYLHGVRAWRRYPLFKARGAARGQDRAGRRGLSVLRQRAGCRRFAYSVRRYLPADLPQRSAAGVLLKARRASPLGELRRKAPEG